MLHASAFSYSRTGIGLPNIRLKELTSNPLFETVSSFDVFFTSKELKQENHLLNLLHVYGICCINFCSKNRMFCTVLHVHQSEKAICICSTQHMKQCDGTEVWHNITICMVVRLVVCYSCCTWSGCCVLGVLPVEFPFHSSFKSYMSPIISVTLSWMLHYLNLVISLNLKVFLFNSVYWLTFS
jgi:hypothetical protein